MSIIVAAGYFDREKVQILLSYVHTMSIAYRLQFPCGSCRRVHPSSYEDKFSVSCRSAEKIQLCLTLRGSTFLLQSQPCVVRPPLMLKCKVGEPGAVFHSLWQSQTFLFYSRVLV